MGDLSPEEIFKRKNIIKYIKTGKPLIRKGLFAKIFYLAGLASKYANIFNSGGSKNYLDRQVSLNALLMDDATLLKLEPFLNKYLEEFELRKESIAIVVLYKKDRVRWDLIDSDLRNNHSNNIKEKEGIPYIKDYYK
jgi:hypothetical protein